MNTPHAKPRTIIATAFAALITLTTVFIGQPAHASPRMLTAAQLASSAPKTVIIDTRTGKITESWFGIAATARPAISNHAICNSTDSCYVSGSIPYADQGFYGSAGTKTGTWPDRSEIVSENRTVSACWASKCSPNLGPYTQAALNPPVTGTSFTIH